MARSPDLRHVRYVALRPHPPGRAPASAPTAYDLLRAASMGAMACGALGGLVGAAGVGIALGAVVGAASPLLRALGGEAHAATFALVPWGLLVERDDDVSAVRWSGVRELDVSYRASADGDVHARVAVDSVLGPLVGFSSGAVDVGMLAGDLSLIADASSRPIALDLAGTPGPRDGEPFVDRVLDAARTLLSRGDVDLLGIEPSSYRDAQGRASGDDVRVARALRRVGEAASEDADLWALLAAIAGELRLRAFGDELARLSNAPHPCVAAFARTALARIGPFRDPETGEAARADADVGESLAWFLPPEEVPKLRAWREGRDVSAT